MKAIQQAQVIVSTLVILVIKFQHHMKRENESDEGLEDTTEEAMSKLHKIQTSFISKLPPLEMPNIKPSVFNPRGRPPVLANITTQTTTN